VLARESGVGHKDIYRVAASEWSLVSSSGFMLGIVGGLLDFGSATTTAIGQGGVVVGGYSMSGSGWAAVLAGLGVLVVAASVLSVTSTGVRHLRAFSVLMVVLGLVMAIVGSFMSGGAMMGASLVYGYGMIIVGILMVINGAMMLRNPMPI
jgi:hypothetical protein